jgi:hypothetical protein
MRLSLIAIAINVALVLLLWMTLNSPLGGPKAASLYVPIWVGITTLASLIVFRLWAIEDWPHPWVAGSVLAIWTLPSSLGLLTVFGFWGFPYVLIVPTQVALAFIGGTLISSASHSAAFFYSTSVIAAVGLAFLSHYLILAMTRA